MQLAVQVEYRDLRAVHIHDPPLTRRELARKAKVALEKANANLLGVVLNNVRADANVYRYYNEAYDPSFPAGLRNVGLRTMVFAVPDPYDKVEDIAPVWAMKPDIIATDRNDFFQYVALPQPF